MAHTHTNHVLYQICHSDIGEDPMYYNADTKECNMHQNNQPCVLSSKKRMKNLHQNMNPIRSKENMKTQVDQRSLINIYIVMKY